MLSKKYLFIKKILEIFSKIDGLHQRLVVLSQLYMDIDRGYRFSYMPDENGELELIDKLSKIYSNNFSFFDVGAHIGTFSDIIIETFDNYEGHLFEITPLTFEKCKRRMSNYENLTLNDIGLADSIGEIDIRVYPDDPTRNGIAGTAEEKEYRYEIVKSKTTTGEFYTKEKGIDHIHFLKIDAEGYDLHVLKGFQTLLKEHKVDVIMFEYNFRHGDVHVVMRDFYDFLVPLGYKLGPLRKFGVDFKDFDPQDNAFDRGPNFVACQEEFFNDLSKF